MYEYLDRRYALALYQLAEEKNKVEEFREDLKQVVGVMYSNEELLTLIKYPQVSISRKKQVFIDIFKDKIDKDLLSFLLILIDKGRILYLKEKEIELEKIYFEKHNMILAHIKTVIPLEDEERNILKEKLEKKYKKTIVLEEEIDKTILGGVFIKIGDDAIDGTLKGRLDEIRKMVLKKE